MLQIPGMRPRVSADTDFMLTPKGKEKIEQIGPGNNIELRVLEIIDSESPQSASDISKKMMIEVRRVKRVLERMEQKGLISSHGLGTE